MEEKKHRGGAPLGNQNAKSRIHKIWTAAIERALKKRGFNEKGLDEQNAALDELAEKFLQICDAKEVAAFRELGDRLEGKVQDTIEHKGSVPVVFSKEDEQSL